MNWQHRRRVRMCKNLPWLRVLTDHEKLVDHIRECGYLYATTMPMKHVVRVTGQERDDLAALGLVDFDFRSDRGRATGRWVLAGYELVVFAGALTDGPSGPAVDTAGAMRGALFHDFLYAAHRPGLIGDAAIRRMDREARGETGMPSLGLDAFRAQADVCLRLWCDTVYGDLLLEGSMRLAKAYHPDRYVLRATGAWMRSKWSTVGLWIGGQRAWMPS
jgi:hypothetical protein